MGGEGETPLGRWAARMGAGSGPRPGPAAAPGPPGGPDDRARKARLAELARAYGREGDYHEVAEFVAWCHRRAGVPCPDLEPGDDQGA